MGQNKKNRTIKWHQKQVEQAVKDGFDAFMQRTKQSKTKNFNSVIKES